MHQVQNADACRQQQYLLSIGRVIRSEGSDTFDALSRSYNYVFQSPWNYIWYSLVAVAYGAVLVFFVGFMGSFVVYLTKWSLSQTPGALSIAVPGK